jgi:hypothetical protein
MRLALVSVLMLAACAGSPQPGGPVHFNGEAMGGVGETIRLHDLSIRTTEVLEDSRCPAEVQCVWAGRVVVRAEIRGQGWSRTEDLELGRGIALEDARALRLSTVTPSRSQGAPPQAGAYRLTWSLGPGD